MQHVKHMLKQNWPVEVCLTLTLHQQCIKDRPTDLASVSISNEGDGLRWEHKLFSSQAMLAEQSWDQVPLQSID